MKINIEFEVSDDIIEEIVTNFCKEMGIETFTYHQRNAIINGICEVIKDEMAAELKYAVDYLSLVEVKYKLGKKSFESMIK